MELTGEHIKTKGNIEAAFHTLNLCPQEDKEEKSNDRKKQEKPANQSKSLTDSDTSDDTEVNPRFKTWVEEREYNTIPGSATAT